MSFFDWNHGLTLWRIWKKNTTTWSEYFYSLEMIVFDWKDPKTLIQDYFCPKTGNEKNAVFWLKSQVNPFGKSGKMQLPEVKIFIGSKQSFFMEKISKLYYNIL